MFLSQLFSRHAVRFTQPTRVERSRWTALTSQDLHLPVQRREPGELRDHHMGRKGGRRHAVIDQPLHAFAWTTAPSQPRQAYLGRIMRSTRVEAKVRFAAELGYEVTVVRDATASHSDREMHAALDVNIPNYETASAAAPSRVSPNSRALSWNTWRNTMPAQRRSSGPSLPAKYSKRSPERNKC